MQLEYAVGSTSGYVGSGYASRGAYYTSSGTSGTCPLHVSAFGSRSVQLAAPMAAAARAARRAGRRCQSEGVLL